MDLFSLMLCLHWKLVCLQSVCFKLLCFILNQILTSLCVREREKEKGRWEAAGWQGPRCELHSWRVLSPLLLLCHSFCSALPPLRRKSEFGLTQYEVCATVHTVSVKRETKKHLLFPFNPEWQQGCKWHERALLEVPVLSSVLKDGGVSMRWEMCGLQHI